MSSLHFCIHAADDDDFNDLDLLTLPEPDSEDEGREEDTTDDPGSVKRAMDNTSPHSAHKGVSPRGQGHKPNGKEDLMTVDHGDHTKESTQRVKMKVSAKKPKGSESCVFASAEDYEHLIHDSGSGVARTEKKRITGSSTKVGSETRGRF
jgi:hypothetical protein